MAKLMRKDEMKPGAVAEGGSMGRLYVGSWRTYVPVWDAEKCIHCMACWIMCPDSSVPVSEGKRQETDFDHCKGCGICAEECPVDAITMELEGDAGEDD